MRPLVAGPIEIVIQLLQTVWNVYVVGAFRAVPQLARWIGDGDWFRILMKVGILFMLLVVARSMWVRLADVEDSSPMTPVIAVALLMAGGILALIAQSLGYWRGF